MNLISAVLSLAAISSASAAPAGKFAANWNDDEMAMLYGFDPDMPASGAVELLATIKPPGGKSLLIGLSGEISILTTTAVTVSNNKKQRGEGTETATAEGMVDVTVKYASKGTSNICSVGNVAAPGKVTLSARRQTLEAELNLGCKVTGGTIALGCEVTGDLYISLELETTAAHHFNFIATGLDPIAYDVVACFSLSGSASGSTDAGDGGFGEASGYVAVRKRMITVQQVQVAQNGVIEPN